MNWHLLNIEETLELLGSHRSGLSSCEAEERLKKYGRNELKEKKKKPAWLLFLLQFKDVMILILTAAAIISGIIGDIKDAVVILVIVVLNAVIGFVQEFRAEKAMEALKRLAVSVAAVKRNGTVLHLSSAEIVPGDIIMLGAGDMVPADLRIIESYGLKIEEASLTGESYASSKAVYELQDENTALGDRINMAYKSTLVTYGKGVGVAVATGMNTEIGSIARMLQEKETVTPLQKRLFDFGKKLSAAVLGICVILYFVGLIRGEDPVKMLLTAISLAVAAIPEALPAVITIALALGAKKLVKKNALIRKLPAVETLGSVTYICSDKTGTLTQNRMKVQDIVITGEEFFNIPSFSHEQFLVMAMSLNQDTKRNGENEIRGDPTEVALAQFAYHHQQYDKEWEKKYPRVFELPFDSERKMMTTVHRWGNNYLVITKGAVESLLKITANVHPAIINQQAIQMSSAGKRVISYSYKFIDKLTELTNKELECDQMFVGIVAIIDPPRPEAKEAVSLCRQAGIVPVMITGDHPETAKTIASEMGILKEPNDRVLTGPQLNKLSQEEYEAMVYQVKVYARVSPEQKLQIVKTLQNKNQFVAMTGDGVNDAPALKKANIGVAMGITGTDVSKEAAHMILLDDNFATIVKAVREGRRIYDNIRHFIKYVLTCNSAEIWTIFLAPLIGLPLPLLPIHILWINLVTDGLPGLALAGEKAEENIMQRPPRKPGESIFSGGMGIHILWVGLLMGAVTLSTQAWAIQAGDTKWQTMVFTVLCFSQMGHALAIRSDYSFLYKQGLFSNLPLLGSVLLTFLLQLGIIYIPSLNIVFNTQALSIKELLVCILVSSIVFHSVEAEKRVKKFITKRKVDVSG